MTEELIDESWQDIAKHQPPQDESLLVRLNISGMIVYDVAIFVGIQPDGERRWTLADIRLAAHLITDWRRIAGPDYREGEP